MFGEKEQNNMKATAAGISIFALLVCISFGAGDAGTSASPTGVRSQSENFQAKVLKVFVVDDNGAKFRAYMVKWKDFDIIVSDILASTNYKEGDLITFSAVRIEVPGRDTVLGFNITPSANRVVPFKPQ